LSEKQNKLLVGGSNPPTATNRLSAFLFPIIKNYAKIKE